MRTRIAALFALFVTTISHAQIPPDELRVHFIDVGQGDATLFEFSCGAILIDAGGESNSDFDSTVALESYLDAFFARRTDLGNRLDALVLSHPHVDHTRGVPLVLKRFAPRNVVTNGQTAGSGKYGQIAAHRYAADSEGTPDLTDDVGFVAVSIDKVPGTGLTNGTIDPVTCAEVDPKITVLWGEIRPSTGWTAAGLKNANNHSVVMRVDFGAASFLLTGDLETEGIKALLKKYAETQLLDIDVYKVGHHGAANATTQDLLAATSPKMAVLMNGPEDRRVSWTAWAYGHPRRGVVQMLAGKVAMPRTTTNVRVATAMKAFGSMSLGRAVYSTGWDGTVVVRAKSDGAISVVPEGPASSPVDVNVASAEVLMELPSLGPRRAEAIVTYRESHGPFGTLESLDDVPGIGPATITTIRDYVTIASP